MYLEFTKHPYFSNIKFWDSVKFKIGAGSWQTGKVLSVGDLQFVVKA